MDLAYWGLRYWPFGTQSRHAGAMGASQEEALARLLFLVDERRRCGQVYGAPGIGKSRLLQMAGAYAERRGRRCLTPDVAGGDAAEFTWQVADALLVDLAAHRTAGRLWLGIQEQLSNLALVGQPVVVLCDDLDLAGSDVANAVRRLMTVAQGQGTELTLLLAGRTPVSAPVLQDEIELFVELSPWTRSEVGAFIATSLGAAGSSTGIFSEAALAAIHDMTRGVPRDVVRLCELSLLAAMNDERREIDAATVRAAGAELWPGRTISRERRFKTEAVAGL